MTERHYEEVSTDASSEEDTDRQRVILHGQYCMCTIMGGAMPFMSVAHVVLIVFWICQYVCC